MDTNGDRDYAIADLTEAVQLRLYSPETIAALKQLKPEAPDQIITPGYLKPFLGNALIRSALAIKGRARRKFSAAMSQNKPPSPAQPSVSSVAKV